MTIPEQTLNAVAEALASVPHMKLSDNVAAVDFQGMAKAAILAYQQSLWQPIETAPKDGTEVNIWFSAREMSNSRGNWIRDGYLKTEAFLSGDEWLIYSPEGDYLSAGMYIGDVPTHWQPLPTPPTEKENA